MRTPTKQDLLDSALMLVLVFFLIYTLDHARF
jgi:hypothetical protein